MLKLVLELKARSNDGRWRRRTTTAAIDDDKDDTTGVEAVYGDGQSIAQYRLTRIIPTRQSFNTLRFGRRPQCEAADLVVRWALQSPV